MQYISTIATFYKNYSTHKLMLAALVMLLCFSFEYTYAQIETPNRPNNTQSNSKSEEQLAINYYRNRQFDKAAELFKPLFDTKRSQYLYMYYFNCLIEIKDFKEAEKVVKKQRRAYPDNFRYLIDQAYVYDQTDEKKKANRLFSELMSDLPLERNNIIQLASALQSKGYYDLAVLVYKKSQQNPDMKVSFNMEIANVYMYSGEYGKVFDSYLDQIESNPQDMQRIRNQLQNLLRMDVENNLSDEFRTKLLIRAQRNTDSEALAEMLLWYSIQIKDFPMALRQAKAIDRRFGFREEEVMELAEIAFQNRQFTISKEAFAYIQDKKTNSPYLLEASTGYYRALVSEAESNMATTRDEYKKLAREGSNNIKQFGLNNYTVEMARLQAHILAFQLSQFDESIELLNEAIEIQNLQPAQLAAIKLELADILLASNQIWDATLLYSQVESEMKNEPIGHEAKLKNAKVFYYVGEFGWSQARLDILKSATSKLISNDAIDLSLFITDILEEDTLGFTLRKFATADLYTYQHHYDSALSMLTKIEMSNPGYVTYPYVLYKKAQLLTKNKQFTEADSVYTLIIEQYPDNIKTDNALYHQAELRRQNLNNPSGAIEGYLKLMTDYPESLYSGEARIRYRALKEEVSE